MASRWSAGVKVMPRLQPASNRNLRRRAPLVGSARRVGAGGMFARAVSALRLIPVLLAALVAVSGCGGESQDADEPDGTYRLEVADASFPAQQSIAEKTAMKIAVRNPGRRTVPHVAVTVETKGANSADGVTAFGQKSDDSRLADTNRA